MYDENPVSLFNVSEAPSSDMIQSVGKLGIRNTTVNMTILILGDKYLWACQYSFGLYWF